MHSDTEPVAPPIVRERRAVAKAINYSMSDEEDTKISSDDEDMFHDNDAIVEDNTPAHIEKMSDSEDDNKPPPVHETSEDMFDNLVGRKKTDDVKEKSKPVVPKKRKIVVSSQSDSDVDSMDFNIEDSDDEDFAPAKSKKGASKSKTKAAPKSRKKKKVTSDSDDD